MISKKNIIPIVTMAAVMGALLLGPTPALATSSTSNSNPFSGLITFIAQKFGLDQNQVKTAVDDYHTKNQQNMQANMATREKTRLDALVKSGKITSAQEQLILNEQAALKSKYNPANFKTLTSDQRKAKFIAEEAEVKAWAITNNIDPKYVMLGPGLGMRNMRGKMGKWGNISPTPTP